MWWVYIRGKSLREKRQWRPREHPGALLMSFTAAETSNVYNDPFLLHIQHTDLFKDAIIYSSYLCIGILSTIDFRQRTISWATNCSKLMATKSWQSKYTGEITVHNDLPHSSPHKQWYTAGEVKIYTVFFWVPKRALSVSSRFLVNLWRGFT